MTASASPASAEAQTPAQERVLARYRQMLTANPVEGTALDRLWKMAEANRTTTALLEEYAKLADSGDFSGQMIHGLLLRRSGDEAAAQKRFEEAAATQPDSPLPHLALADRAEGEARATALDKAASLLAPDSPLLPGLLQKTGDAWIALGHPDRVNRAGAAWERMVALDPSNIELRQRIAEAYTAADAPDRAAPHYDFLEKHGDPATRAGALRSLAGLKQEKGDTEGAIALLEKAIELTSSDNWMRADLITRIVRYSRESGTTQALEARWKDRAEGQPASVGSWQQLATLYRQEGEPEKEREALKKLLALQPENLVLKRDLARLLVKLDAPREAQPLLDELIAAQPAHRPDPDLIFDRATLDVRLHRPEEAQQRLSALAGNEASGSEEERRALITRILAFYQEHRMLEALEEMLKRPGSDPVELALFLFNAKRPEEARAALKLLEKGEKGARPAAHQVAADRLKQAGEHEASLEQCRIVAQLQPDSRTAQVALGEIAMMLGAEHRQTAVDAFTRAVALAKDPRERVAADQLLFRAYEGVLAPPKEGQKNTLASAAGKAMEALLSVPTSPSPPPEPVAGAALQEFIGKLAAEANADAANPALWLRLARWQFWKREFVTARASLEKAAALRPNDRDTLELGVAIAQGSGDPTEAVQWIKRLIAAYPDAAPGLQKQLAMIRLQSGEIDEGLQILEGLAASGDPTALADLARGQQQAERWYDALETWQRLYATAKSTHRYDALQPLVRAMQRLELHPRAADTLWTAYEEQSDPALRSALLADLIAQCKTRNTFPWLLEKLEGRVNKPGDPADLQAWAAALKAAGQPDRAYTALKSAAIGALDRAAAEAELSKEAEELGDFAGAAKHQHQRLLFLPSPPAEEWERLAALQETALDYQGADETYRALAKRFPRSTATLLKTAAYFEKWGQDREATAIYSNIFRFDPMALSAAAGVVRLSENPLAVADAAEKLLKHSKANLEDKTLILPEAPTMIGNRLRTQFQVLGSASAHGGMSGSAGGDVLLFNERGFGSNEAEWRLEAIRALARQVTPVERPAWVKRWREDRTASPSEVLWALFYAHADRELFAQAVAFADAEPAIPARRLAVIWLGLQGEVWSDLAKWLWGPGRAGADYSNFRTFLSEWMQLGRPLDTETLLRKAPVLQIWSTAETLNLHRRVRDAAAIGQRLLEDLPSPVAQLGEEPCLRLAQWLLATGDIGGAETLLRRLAVSPADSLDAPPFAAQRALYKMLPPLERKAWVREMLAQKGSLVFSAYTAALLHTLEGSRDQMQPALDRLVRVGSGPLSDATTTDRTWNGLLRAGVQFERWHQSAAAIYLWEKALADHALLQLQGDRAAVYSHEVERRLAALRLTRAELHEVPTLLSRMTTAFSMADLHQIAAQLDGSGHKVAAAQVHEAMSRKEPRLPLDQLIKAYQATGDEGTLRSRVEEWCAQPKPDATSAPIMIETLARWDRPRAMKLAKQINSEGGGHPALLAMLGQWQLDDQAWKEAAATYQQLLLLEPHNPSLPVQLAVAQAALGFKVEALEQLRRAPRKTPQIDLKRLELALELEDIALARQIASELLHGSTWEPVMEAGAIFAKAKRPQEGAALLSAAVDVSTKAGKSRAAFEVQKALVTRFSPLFPKEMGQRWLRRLDRLAKGWPDLISAAVEAGRDSGVASMKEQIDRLTELWAKGTGEPVAGAWLLSHLLDTTIPPQPLLDQVLASPEVSSPLLRWLRGRCIQSKKPELCVKIDEELLRRHPENIEDMITAARTLHSIGRTREATALLEQARPRLLFAIDGKDTGKLALLAYDLGDTPLARELFEEAIEADEAAQATSVYLGYARLLMIDGDFPTAKRVLRQAFSNPANRNTDVLVDYLKRSGRDTPELLPAELRDLDLRPAMKEQVERLLGSPPASPATSAPAETAGHTP